MAWINIKPVSDCDSYLKSALRKHLLSKPSVILWREIIIVCRTADTVNQNGIPTDLPQASDNVLQFKDGLLPL